MSDEFGTAAVRKRPGMYVGPLEGGDGLLNMVLDAVGAAVKEVRAGVAQRVRVAVN